MNLDPEIFKVCALVSTPCYSTSMSDTKDLKGEERPLKRLSKNLNTHNTNSEDTTQGGTVTGKGKTKKDLQTFYVVRPTPKYNSAVYWSPTYLGLSVLDGDLFLGAARMFCIARTRRRRTVLLSL